MASASQSQGDGTSAKSRPQGMKVYECPVCYNLYDREDHLAKSLRCGHTACMACLKQLHSTNNRVRCPNCRKEHALVGSVEDFPTNYSLLDALDTVCVSCQQQLAVETTTKLCPGCFKVYSSAMRRDFQKTIKKTKIKIGEFRDLAKHEVKLQSLSEKKNKLIADIEAVYEKYRNALNKNESNMIEEVKKQANSDAEKLKSKMEDLVKATGVLEGNLEDFTCSSAKQMPAGLTEAAKHLDQLKTSSKEIQELAHKSEKWPNSETSRYEIHDCANLLQYINNCSMHYCGLCADRSLNNEVHSVSADSMWYGEAYVKQYFDNASLGMEVFNNPHDVTISPVNGNVVVANEGNRSLVILQKIEEPSTSFGSRLKTKYEFLNVLKNLGEEKSKFFGVAIDKNDHIYTSDWEGNCVWVFTNTGELVRKIGSAGNGPLQFNYPAGLAIDHEAGHLYICDSKNSRVQVVTLEGQYVRSFGKRRMSIEDDDGPWYIVVEKGNSGRIYVEDSSSRLFVYKKNWAYLHFIETGMSAEYGLAIDKAGNLLTSHYTPHVFLKCTQYDINIRLGDKESHDKKYAFGEVRGITVDDQNKVLVCDYINNNLKVLGSWHM